MMMKPQRGVSLIEVVITISIMGILLAAAMPSVGTWMATSRVRNTAESIQNGLQRARSEAIRLNKPMTFYMVSDLTSSCTLSPTSGTWVVSAASPVGQCNAQPSTTTAPMLVVKAQASDGGGGATVSTSGASTAPTSVTFNGFGQITSASVSTAIRVVTLVSADGVYKRNVEVSLGGLGRVCDPTLTALTNTGDTRACNNSAAN